MGADCARKSAAVVASSGGDAAAANPNCGGNWNRLQIFVVIVSMPAGSARIAGVPNNVIDCRNATMNPPSKAGSTSGKVTCSAVRHAGAPRIADASSSSLGIASRALAAKVKTYGNVYSAITKTMPHAEKMLINDGASNGLSPASA